MSRFVCACLTVLLFNNLYAEDWQPLWPNGAPGANGSAEHDVPALLAFPAPKETANGSGVIVCPGGGYGGLAMDHEGYQIVKWLNDRGIRAWILRYRLGSKGYHHPIQKNDVLRAVRVVRVSAPSKGVDPRRLGIWGFSAGGHLASTAATHFDKADTNPQDGVDHVSSRPGFAILCYPVISMVDGVTHTGSRRNLLGNDRYEDEKLITLLSNEKQVTAKTPPTFIFHTTEDQAVPVENAIRFYSALQKNGVHCELHVYQKGRHGVGLGGTDPVLRTWPERLEDWLRANSFLPADK